MDNDSIKFMNINRIYLLIYKYKLYTFRYGHWNSKKNF